MKIEYALIAVIMVVIIGIDVYHAFRGKAEGKIRARQSLVLIGIALAGILVWRVGSTLLTEELGVDDRISMLVMAAVCMVPAALLYNKLSVKVSGMTPEQQCRAQMERYANRGDFTAAIQQAHKLVAINCTAENYYFLGRCYELDKDYKKAIKFYTSSIELDPEFYMSYNNMGTSYLNLKENELAKEALEKAFAIKPDHPFVPANLAFTYACFGETEKAREFLKKARENGYEDRGDEILHKIEAAERETAE